MLHNCYHQRFYPSVVRVCEELAKEGEIIEKIYGKQKVYCADQGKLPSVNENELKEMDESIKQLNDRLKTSREKCRESEQVLSSLNSSISTEDAKIKITDLSQKIKHGEDKLKSLKSAGNHVTEKEKEAIYNLHSKNMKHWRKRKRMTKDILDAILEGYPKTKKTLYEEIGIETDEEYNVQLPQ
ncbi:homologous-pairing protein 2 homolog isoform X2 [Anneissia japonica]|uniref:homologous-pairing protein 2 homolog isoform X2 n=1 Tax=Anneissia japonica TaxID=1529436 RepID=UPI0014259B79|nr:homologous-pairing protein 2 homolog isoform X2 [Anneissia japonica]